PVRAPRSDHQRRLLPAAARSRRRRGRGGADVVSRRARESGGDGGLGIDRRRRPVAWLAAVPGRPRGGDAGVWTRHLAPLQEGGRARPAAATLRADTVAPPPPPGRRGAASGLPLPWRTH